MIYKDNLKSARLTTRFVTKEDAAIWVKYCSDPVATKFTRVPGLTPEEMAEFVMERTLTRYADGRLGLQVLISKETGAFIGKCGLLLQDINGVQEMEVGYHLLPEYWGQGYAAEAAQLFRDHGFEHSDVDSIVSLIAIGNVPSQKVAEKNGMKVTAANIDFMGKPINVYRITRQEWEQLKLINKEMDKPRSLDDEYRLAATEDVALINDFKDTDIEGMDDEN